MQENNFYRLGKLIYKIRWLVIFLWLVAIIACIPFIPSITSPFKSTGFTDETSDSAKAEQFLNKELGYNNYNKFILIYHSKKLLATDPLFLERIKKSLEKLKGYPIKNIILYPDPNNKKQISKDKHTAYVAVILRSTKPINDDLLKQFKNAVEKPKQMTVELGGEPIFVEGVNKQTQIDLYKADIIATPVSIITLLIVFGSVLAALLPIVLGGGGAVIILTTLYILGHNFALSIFTINIALLLGLCLILDYSLFIISRFRDELAKNSGIAEAVARTQASAGKAIFFSGLAVFASLSALLLFPINILFSIGMGGLAAVFVAVLIAILLLPAVLAVLKTGINLLPVHFLIKREGHVSFWHWLAEKVVRAPWTFFLISFVILLSLGYPFLFSKFGLSDFRILPKNSEYRRFFDIYATKFKESELTPIQLIVQSKQNTVYSRSNIDKLYDLANKIKKKKSVAEVNSIVTTDPKLTSEQYYQLYKERKNLPSSIKKLLSSTTRNYLTVMSVVSKNNANSPKTKQLITDLERLKIPNGLSVKLTGTPVINQAVLKSINQTLPYAILWIMIFTYLILLLLLRSLFLPLKAILMNILSLSACYGALVLVFQEGYLHQFLNFEPQGMLDISLLVIIFCALFGFSMDYEVFLLTRIKESYLVYGDNNKSIIFGIEKSSRIITSAALIVIFICCSFLVAEVMMVKAFGLGIAVAIFVDAFLIRTILVPSTMAIINKVNWYLPKWMEKILPRF